VALDAQDVAPAERVEASRKAGNAAKEQMRVLTLAIEKILASMQKMTDINELVKRLAEIEKTEAEQFEMIKKINDELEDKIFGKVSGGKPEGKK
jgi:hypothetical protein